MSAYLDELRAFYAGRQDVTYTDGTPVQEGDRIRYHQAPGGLMAHGDWRYGVAVRLPVPHVDSWELVLRGNDDGRHYGLYGHVIETVTVAGNGCAVRLAVPTDTCPGCGAAGVVVGLDCVLLETRPAVRRHVCGMGGPGSAVDS